MLSFWSLVPLPFINPAWISGSSQFMYCWSLAWSILSITLQACEMSAIVRVVWTFFGIIFLWDWNENWPFPVLWALLSFPNLLAYWVAALSQHHLSGFEIAQLDPGLGGENCFIRRVLINSTYVVFFPRLCHGAAHLRLEISSRKLEISREHFMQKWAWSRTEMVWT